MGFLKKKPPKNKLYKVSTCCTCCCNFIVYTHAPLSSSLALSYLHGTPLFFPLRSKFMSISYFKVFMCVCVHTSVQERVYLYVGHLVAIRVNHPSFLRLAVSHKLTWTHTMRHTQLLLEHDSALDGVGKKYWQPSSGQNGGGMGQEREEWRIGRGREWRWRSRKKGSRMCETGYRTKIGGLDNDTAVQLKWMWKRGVKWPDSKSSIRLVCVEAGEWVRRNTHENKNIRLPTTEWYLFFSWIHLWIREKFRPNAFHHCSSSDRIVI